MKRPSPCSWRIWLCARRVRSRSPVLWVLRGRVRPCSGRRTSPSDGPASTNASAANTHTHTHRKCNTVLLRFLTQIRLNSLPQEQGNTGRWHNKGKPLMEVRCFCAPGLTEWVCEFENDVIKLLQALQSQGLNPVEQLWKYWTKVWDHHLHKT